MTKECRTCTAQGGLWQELKKVLKTSQTNFDLKQLAQKRVQKVLKKVSKHAKIKRSENVQNAAKTCKNAKIVQKKCIQYQTISTAVEH